MQDLLNPPPRKYGAEAYRCKKVCFTYSVEASHMYVTYVLAVMFKYARDASLSFAVTLEKKVISLESAAAPLIIFLS
jgi:hypothetical protein